MTVMQRGKMKIRTGVVVKDAMDKTVVVEVAGIKSHGRYKKQIRTSKRFKAHDERNSCSVGDVVEITESRPYSKTKRWRVSRVVEAAAGA